MTFVLPKQFKIPYLASERIYSSHTHFTLIVHRSFELIRHNGEICKKNCRRCGHPEPNKALVPVYLLLKFQIHTFQMYNKSVRGTGRRS